MTGVQLHRRAFVFGALAVGAAVAAAGQRGAEAAPALPMSPARPDMASGTLDTIFRPDEDTVTAEAVRWRRDCFIDRWGRRVCVRRRWVCWWHRGRRICGWR